VSDRRFMPEPRYHLIENFGDARVVVNDEDADLVVGHA
jgi:hypothetical protein